MTTSALLVGLPFLLTVEGEAAMMAQEKEYLGQQQVSSSSPRVLKLDRESAWPGRGCHRCPCGGLAEGRKDADRSFWKSS